MTRALALHKSYKSYPPRTPSRTRAAQINFENNFEKLLIGERTPFLKYYLQNSFLEDNVSSLIQLGIRLVQNTAILYQY
jgi:hypothetical protein